MHKDLALLPIVIITFITEAETLISMPSVEINLLMNTKKIVW